MESDESDYDNQVEATKGVDEDRDTLRRSNTAIGLTRSYVPSWTSRDAFREFFQNWMDGMMTAQNLPRNSIKIEIQDTNSEWLATALSPKRKTIIGFIKFSKSKGTLELTNFMAQLPRKSLDMGVSSKRKKANLAGTHGEGFKVASLVMVRKGYQVRYESTSFYWNFYFGGRDKRGLYCRLTPMKDTLVDKKIQQDAIRIRSRQPRQLVSNIWEDVTVKIGKVYGQNGASIDVTSFQSWIKVALALEHPAKTFETNYGKLILDPKFSGRIYLKGLFLGNSSHSKSFKFAYDLNQGDVNRDRARLSDAREEASLLAKIWADLIATGEAEVIKEYTKMLREDSSKQWADINFAKDFIRDQTAQTIWAHLKSLDCDRKLFYHHEKTAEKDSTLIRFSLKKTPVALPTCLWQPLAKFGLVRTPEKQRHHLLANALISKLVETPYSTGMKRSLLSALALDDETNDLCLTFRSGAATDLDLIIDGTILIVNDKWLRFDTIHREYPCWLSEENIPIEKFPCDHIINSLYEMILHQLYGNSIAKNVTSFRRKVAEALRQMPRMIKISKGFNAGELTVNWTVMESQFIYQIHGLQLKYQVTLHRNDSCSDKREDLLFSVDSTKPKTASGRSRKIAQEIAKCGCPCKIVASNAEGVTFQNLVEGEKYFALVSRFCDQAFVNFSTETEEPTVALHDRADTPESAETSRDSTPMSNYSARLSNPESLRDQPSPSFGLAISHRANSPALTKRIPSVREIKQENQYAVDTDVPMGNFSHGSSIFSKNADRKKKKAAINIIKANLEKLGNIRETLRAKEEQLRLASEKLNIKEAELNIITEALESKELELRKVNEDKDAAKQQLESRIEDFSGESQQLRTIQAELEAQCAQLSSTIEILHEEAKQSQKIKAENDVPISSASVNHDLALPELQTEIVSLMELNSTLRSQLSRLESQVAKQDVVDTTPQIRSENHRLKDTISNLRSEINQLQASRGSLVSTLQNVSTMIQEVLNLHSRDFMAANLQGILCTIRGVLNIENKSASSQKSHGFKRELVKEEDAAEGSAVRAPKRIRRHENFEVILLD